MIRRVNDPAAERDLAPESHWDFGAYVRGFLPSGDFVECVICWVDVEWRRDGH